jgi:diguanylate cyclase (GGDEF)-like protein
MRPTGAPSDDFEIRFYRGIGQRGLVLGPVLVTLLFLPKAAEVRWSAVWPAVGLFLVVGALITWEGQRPRSARLKARTALAGSVLGAIAGGFAVVATNDPSTTAVCALLGTVVVYPATINRFVQWSSLSVGTLSYVVAQRALGEPLSDTLVRAWVFAGVAASISATVSFIVRELRASQAELGRHAMTDPLTGVRNRRALERRLAESTLGPTTSVMVDLDHFKDYNDRHGHLAGDVILRRFGEMLDQELRDPDVVVRYGGEEFCLLLHTDVQGAERVIERLRATWHSIGDGITFSAGISSAPGEAGVDEADRALYRAKAAGRNCTVAA